MKNLTTEELIRQIDQPGTTLVDVRPMAAYNGWKLNDEKRGGHIPGAKSVPLQWTDYMDWLEVLEEKQIRRNDPVVIYGYSGEDSAGMAEKLCGLGFEDLYVYDGFVKEWSSDPQLPLEQLSRYRHLVHAGWVRQLIDGGSPEEYDNDEFVICHSHYDHPDDYAKGHIPGAVPMDTNSLESTETWNRRTPEELRETLRALGIRHDTTVIVYGRYSAPNYDAEKFPGKSAGHLGALRCAAIMLYAGVEDIRILNGGITAWETAGYELSTEPVHPEPVDDFGVDIPAHPEYMIDIPEARELLAANDGELVSIRSWEEFIGNRSGYHYIDRKGRIPGAVFGNCGSDAYNMENYRNFDHTMREFHEIKKAWEEGGITADKKIAFYCGTGWRGSEAFLNAWLMGWPNIAVFDGGWYEWCSDPDNPIETGTPDSSQ